MEKVAGNNNEGQRHTQEKDLRNNNKHVEEEGTIVMYLLSFIIS